MYFVLFLDHLHFGCKEADPHLRVVRVSFCDGRVRFIRKAEWDRHVAAYGRLRPTPDAAREEEL